MRYVEFSPAVVPFRSLYDMLQLVTHFAERSKPAADNEKRNVLVPAALKLTFRPGMNSSSEEDGHPCPCDAADPVPTQGLGNAPKTSGEKNNKLVYILCSTQICLWISYISKLASKTAKA